MSESLTQDEVDALMTGIDDAEKTTNAGTQVRPFDPLAEDPLIAGRMPALEVVNERFCRLLRSGLSHFMGRVPEIAGDAVRAIKYADFIAALPAPANHNVVRVKPLGANALFVFEPTLIYLIVDSLFGGDGRFQPRMAARECTPTEHRIVERLLGIVLSDYEKAWKNLYPLSFKLVRSEWSSRLATIADAADIVIAMSFTVGSGAASGAFHVGIPLAALRPLRAVLCGDGEKSETVEPDPRWLRSLSKQVEVTEVEVVADLLSVPVTVAQVLSMTVGDVLSVDIPQTVKARVEGVPVFDCRYGTLNGQYALRIASALIPEMQPPAGEQHAQ